MEVIDELNSSIENGEVKGIHCRPLAEIIAQTYQLQLESCDPYEYHSRDKATLAAAKARKTLLQKQNNVYKNAFLGLLKNHERVGVEDFA